MPGAADAKRRAGRGPSPYTGNNGFGAGITIAPTGIVDVTSGGWDLNIRPEQGLNEGTITVDCGRDQTFIAQQLSESTGLIEVLSGTMVLSGDGGSAPNQIISGDVIVAAEAVLQPQFQVAITVFSGTLSGDGTVYFQEPVVLDSIHATGAPDLSLSSQALRRYATPVDGRGDGSAVHSGILQTRFAFGRHALAARSRVMRLTPP